MPAQLSHSATVRQAARNAVLLVSIVAILVYLAVETVETVSAARAYVGGEGLWSKAQRDAVHALTRYGARRDDADFLAFRAALAVPLGDRQAREELERPHPDAARVRDGFLQGRNHPDDIPRMARFFRRFRGLRVVQEAVSDWTQGDSLIALLAAAGDSLHTAVTSPRPDQAAIDRQLARIEGISGELATLEDGFSSVLQAGARWAASVGLILITTVAVVLLAIATLSEWTAVRRSAAAEASLRQSETRLRNLVEHASSGILQAAPDGALQEANPALARMLGYRDTAALLGAGLLGRLLQDPGQLPVLFRQLDAGPDQDLELGFVRGDGGIMLGRVSGRALKDGGGAITGYEAFIEDITVRRALETQLRQAQKMETVGQLTGGIAHDFNNLLTVITSIATLVEQSISEQEIAARADLAELKRTARRGGEMIRKLLSFSRTRQLQFHPMALNGLVQAGTDVLRRLLPEHIDVKLGLTPEDPVVDSDPAALEQILLNLATNARDAMPGGGTLLISTNVSRRHGSGDRPWAVLTVRDSGEGMDPSTRDRLFDPFFTTKPPGQGTGLGLTMVYGLVKQHGGGIEVDSTPGVGTTMRLYFPLAEQEPDERDTPEEINAAGSGTILLVEDEPALARAGQRLLEGQGYLVLVAADGVQALELLARHEEIRLVFSDVVMPNLGGVDLYLEARRRGLGRPFILTSGYLGWGSKSGSALPEGVPFLPKPWEARDLLLRIHELLAQRSGGSPSPPSVSS